MSTEKPSYTKNRFNPDRRRKKRISFEPPSSSNLLSPPDNPTDIANKRVGIPSPLEAALALKSKYTATLHKGLITFLDDLTDQTLRLYSEYFLKDVTYQENCINVNYIPKAIKTIGVTFQSLEEVKNSKDYKAILDRYVADEEATKLRWTNYIVEVDNLTRLGLKHRFQASFCVLLTSAARGFTAEIGTHPSYTEHEAVMDLLVTSPSLLLGDPLFLNDIEFLTRYKSANKLPFLPMPTVKHSLEDTLLNVNGFSRKQPPIEMNTESTSMTTNDLHDDTTLVSTTTTNTTSLTEQPTPARDEPTSTMIQTPPVASTIVRDPQTDPPPDAASPIVQDLQSIPPPTLLEVSTIGQDLHENQLPDDMQPPPQPELPIPTGSPPTFPDTTITVVDPPTETLQTAASNLADSSSRSNSMSTSTSNNPPRSTIPVTNPYLNLYGTQQFETARANLNRQRFLQTDTETPNPNPISTPAHNTLLDNLTDVSFDYEDDSFEYEYTNTPTISKPPPMPSDPKHGEVLNLLRQFAEKAICLPLKEFHTIASEKEVTKRIKSATEPIIFISAAERIAAVVNKEDAASRPIITGLIKTATNKCNKDINRRMQALQSTHTTLMKKYKSLEQQHKQNSAKKDRGINLQWSRKSNNTPIPPAAATVYRFKKTTTTPTPALTAQTPNPTTTNPTVPEGPPKDSNPNKEKSGKKRSRSRSIMRGTTTEKSS